MRAVPACAAEDPLLRDALATVAAKERSAQDLVGRLGKGLGTGSPHRLVERGVLERAEAGSSACSRARRWPAVDARHEQDVRRELHGRPRRGRRARPAHRRARRAARGRRPGPQGSTTGGSSPREVRRRAKQVAEGAWAAKAVRDAVRAATAATTAAVTAGRRRRRRPGSWPSACRGELDRAAVGPRVHQVAAQEADHEGFVPGCRPQPVTLRTPSRTRTLTVCEPIRTVIGPFTVSTPGAVIVRVTRARAACRRRDLDRRDRLDRGGRRRWSVTPACSRAG